MLRRPKKRKILPFICLAASFLVVLLVSKLEEEERFDKKLKKLSATQVEWPEVKVHELKFLDEGSPESSTESSTETSTETIPNSTAKPTGEVAQNLVDKGIDDELLAKSPRPVISLKPDRLPEVKSLQQFDFRKVKTFLNRITVHEDEGIPAPPPVQVVDRDGNIYSAMMDETVEDVDAGCFGSTIINRKWSFNVPGSDKKLDGPRQKIFITKGIKVKYRQALNEEDLVQIEALVDGGVGPYKITWDNGQVGDVAFYDEPGHHYAIVEDAVGCGLLQEFKIPKKSALPAARILIAENTEASKTDKESTAPLELDAPSYQVENSSGVRDDLKNWTNYVGPVDLKYAVLKTAKNGQLDFNSMGEFEYLPNPEFVGKDSFTVSVCDDTRCILGKIEIKVLSRPDNIVMEPTI